MERTIPPPVRDPHPPRVAPPTGACDAHCHVFGPAHRFPFDPNRTYTPPDADFEDLVALQERLGLSRAVLVQASCHGTDNSAMVDALRRGRGRFAGVAMVNESIGDRELAAMHQAGVRGIRFNFVRHLGGAKGTGPILALAHRVAPLGWHVDLHFDADQIPGYFDLLRRLPTPFIIDHMGRVAAKRGVDQEPFRSLLDLLASEERAWVKLSGAERLGQTGEPPYREVVPLARALIEVAPDRLLWGTDWPHPNVRHMPDDGDLVDLLADFAPEEETRKRILVDNPERLYDFG
ncbi:MAG: amidohydrolase family protein [Acidimicrobiia bacterium]